MAGEVNFDMVSPWIDPTANNVVLSRTMPAPSKSVKENRSNRLIRQDERLAHLPERIPVLESKLQQIFYDFHADVGDLSCIIQTIFNGHHRILYFLG